MDTFGDRLKSEREDRGLSIEAVAGILGVDQGRLLALERNDFEALPDEAEMMDCLHAYAECLQVDADLMIEDYVEERAKAPRGLEDVVVKRVAATAPAAIPPEAERRPRLSPWLVALAVVGIALLAWWMLSRDGIAPTPETSVAAAPTDEPPAEPQPQPSKAAVDPAPTPAEPPATRSVSTLRSMPTAPALSLLKIAAYGVGTAVENRNLLGRSDRFTEGTQVWFQTRVVGGARGDRIDHVWLRDGVEKARVALEIGGPSWRTSSTKTLHPGLAGDWVVEARDDAGRVLARSEFVCVP